MKRFYADKTRIYLNTLGESAFYPRFYQLFLAVLMLYTFTYLIRTFTLNYSLPT